MKYCRNKYNMKTILIAFGTRPEAIKLAPLIIEQIGRSILEIKESGKTVLLAEQNLQMALRVGGRHYIIDNGRLVFQGTSDEIRANAEVQATYLGVSKGRIAARKEGKSG